MDQERIGHYDVIHGRYKDSSVSDMLGLTMAEVVVDEVTQRVLFVATTGEAWVLMHFRDCCEDVSIESVVGDPQDLVGHPLLRSEESTSGDPPLPEDDTYGSHSHTWTFYRFATVKGDVDIRWLGQSNGYYSESVSCVRVHEIIDRSAQYGGPLARQCLAVMDVIPALKIRIRGKLHDLMDSRIPMEQRVQVIAERTALPAEEVQVTLDYLMEKGHLPWTT